jgi:hypothetical protein
VSIELLHFPEPLYADGPVNWGDRARELIESTGWREIAVGVHVVVTHLGNENSSFSITVTQDDRGLVWPTNKAYGLGVLNGGMGRYIDREKPFAPIVGRSVESRVALLGLIRWREGAPKPRAPE